MFDKRKRYKKANNLLKTGNSSHIIIIRDLIIDKKTFARIFLLSVKKFCYLKNKTEVITIMIFSAWWNSFGYF